MANLLPSGGQPVVIWPLKMARDRLNVLQDRQPRVTEDLHQSTTDKVK